jgi:ABC-type uncharacterized transport system ATPase subunit
MSRHPCLRDRTAIYEEWACEIVFMVGPGTKNTERPGKLHCQTALVHLWLKPLPLSVRRLRFAITGRAVIVMMGISAVAAWGKSTLLDCVAGRKTPAAGSIEICGHSLRNEPVAARDPFARHRGTSGGSGDAAR